MIHYACVAQNWPRLVFRQLFGIFFIVYYGLTFLRGSSAECGLWMISWRSPSNLQLLTMISRNSRIPKSSFFSKMGYFSHYLVRFTDIRLTIKQFEYGLDFYIEIIKFLQISKTEFDVGRFEIFLWNNRNTPTTFYKAWVTSDSVIAKKFVIKLKQDNSRLGNQTRNRMKKMLTDL